MTKKIMVLGGTGFIGRNLLEYLSKHNKDYELYGTHNKKPPVCIDGIRWKKINLTNKYNVDMAIRGMDVVIQMAAVTSGVHDEIKKPYIHITDNAIMNSLILRSVFMHKTKHFIFPSCGAFYPDSINASPEWIADECKIPEKYYGVGYTKRYIERMCKFFSKISNTKFTIVRHSNIYGPYDKYNSVKSHVFAATISKVMKAQNKDKVIVWGSGTEQRDFLHVDDLSRFLDIIIYKQKDKFEFINAGSGTPLSVDKLVKKIINHSGKDLSIEYDKSKPTINTVQYLNIKKAIENYNWMPQINIDDGIKRTIEWYRRYYEN